MARRKKNKAAPSEANTVDYRYPHEKRTNIPPGRIAGEGTVPIVQKVRYAYSPHLSPVLRFDPTGKADKLDELADAATKRYLTGR